MTTWANTSRNSSTFTTANRVVGRGVLLIESPFKLLIGEGFFLSIDPTIASNFGLQSKSSSTFVNQSKN